MCKHSRVPQFTACWNVRRFGCSLVLNSCFFFSKNEAAQRPYQAYVPKKLQDLNLVVPGLGGNDDLSPGDGAGNGLNGSIFYNSSDYHRNKHASHSSSQQLHTNSKYTKHRAHQVSSTSDRLHYQVPTISSSASSSPRSIHSIGSYNGQVAAGTGLSSNTAFLLNSTANKPQSSNMQTMNGLNHSKSVSNLHSSVRSNGFDGNGAWDDYDKTSQNNRNSYNSNFDLLGDLDTFDAHFSSHSNHTDRPSTTTAKAGVTSTSGIFFWFLPLKDWARSKVSVSFFVNRLHDTLVPPLSLFNPIQMLHTFDMFS